MLPNFFLRFQFGIIELCSGFLILYLNKTYIVGTPNQANSSKLYSILSIEVLVLTSQYSLKSFSNFWQSILDAQLVISCGSSPTRGIV